MAAAPAQRHALCTELQHTQRAKKIYLRKSNYNWKSKADPCAIKAPKPPRQLAQFASQLWILTFSLTRPQSNEGEATAAFVAIVATSRFACAFLSGHLALRLVAFEPRPVQSRLLRQAATLSLGKRRVGSKVSHISIVP